MTEFELVFGDYRARVATKGAALVALRYGDIDIVPEVPANTRLDRYYGSVIAPWANRIADGRYKFDGVDYQLEINEPDRNNALHGYSAFVDWDLVTVSDDSVELKTKVGGTVGYPAIIQLQVRYGLSESGLSFRFKATNTSDFETPFGYAFHPYFSIPGGLDSNKLISSAKTFVEVDPLRLLPLGDSPVIGSRFDLGSGLEPGFEFLDHAFTDFEFTEQGFANARLEGLAGATAISWDSDWLQLHLPADQLPGEELIVIEPTTSASNGFNSGRGAIRLGANQAFQTNVTISRD